MDSSPSIKMTVQALFMHEPGKKNSVIFLPSALLPFNSTHRQTLPHVV